jgi:gluconolactonase
MRPTLFAEISLLALCGAAPARFGYEAPSTIDGCQSADGRFVVTAELVSGEQVHGPFQWRFVCPAKVPVRPFQGSAELPAGDDRARQSYVPSLDPVRTEGTFREPRAAAPAAEPAPAQSKGAGSMTSLDLVKEGFKKTDTPAWLPAEKCLLFTDLDQAKLFRVDLPDKISVVREEACRAKTGPDGRLYGVFGGKLASWRPGEEPKVILEKVSEGRELSLNDLAVSPAGFLYFTTLKDPDKGRLSVVDVKKKTISVAFDGEVEQDIANPNGVALSADGKHLYVGISNYKNRKGSGVYRFPLRPDGSVDVAAGKSARWAPVAAPDGLALGPDRHLYFTAGAVIHVYSAEGKPVGTVKIPKDSGTNLAFGGEDGRTLFVTTNKALYSGRLPDARE